MMYKTVNQSLCLGLYLCFSVLGSGEEIKPVWKPSEGKPRQYESEFTSRLILQNGSVRKWYQMKLDSSVVLEAAKQPGELDAVITVERIRFAYPYPPDLAEHNFTYDSKVEKQNRRPEEALMGIFKPIIGARLKVRIDRQGKILKVDVPKEIRESYAAGVLQEFSQDVGRIFIEDDFVDFMAAPLIEFPKAPVTKKSNWVALRHFPVFYKEIQDAYEVEAIEEGKTLRCKLQLKVVGEKRKSPVAIEEVEGIAVFDLKNGALDSLLRTIHWATAASCSFEEKLTVKQRKNKPAASKD